MMKPVPEKVLKVLDSIADVVLAYKPKPKTKPARKRKKRAAKIEKETKASADLRWSFPTRSFYKNHYRPNQACNPYENIKTYEKIE